MVKLKDLLAVLGSGEFLRIGTERGRGFLFYDMTINLDDSLPEWVKERPVHNVHSAEERTANRYCRRLESGLVILIEGDEVGTI